MYQFQLIATMKPSLMLPPGVTLKVAIIHPPPPNPFHGAWMRREPIKKQAVPKPKLSKSEKGTVAP